TTTRCPKAPRHKSGARLAWWRVPVSSRLLPVRAGYGLFAPPLIASPASPTPTESTKRVHAARRGRDAARRGRVLAYGERRGYSGLPSRTRGASGGFATESAEGGCSAAGRSTHGRAPRANALSGVWWLPNVWQQRAGPG